MQKASSPTGEGVFFCKGQLVSTYKIAHKASTKDIIVQAGADSLTATYTDIGHPLLKDASDAIADGSQVMFHVVRDAIQATLPLGAPLDMSAYKINMVHPTSISVSPATVTKAVAATQQLTTTFTPAGTSNKGLLYSSSNPAKATVSATGLITAVASGTATITVTTVDGGLVGTCVVTIP